MLEFSGKVQGVSHHFVDERCRVAIGRRVFVNSVRLTDIQMMVQRASNMFDESLHPCSLDFWIFAGGGTMRTDCKILVSRPEDEDGWRML